MSFKYNDEGIRTSKTVGGATTNYYLEGSGILDAYDFANEVKFSVMKNKRVCVYKLKERESKRKSRANFLPVIFYYK